MKSKILRIFLIMPLLFEACQSADQKIGVNDLIISVPKDFTIKDQSAPDLEVLQAQYQDQQIICSFAALPEYDTLTSDQQTSILILNTEKYIEPFKGSEVTISDKMISNVKVIDFSFRYSRNDNSYQVYGNSLAYKDCIYFLTYEVPLPVSVSIQNSIGRFFSSVKVD